eukprot:scaffold505_cov245-Ochromonas_danica.AAC.2
MSTTVSERTVGLAVRDSNFREVSITLRHHARHRNLYIIRNMVSQNPSKARLDLQWSQRTNDLNEPPAFMLFLNMALRSRRTNEIGRSPEAIDKLSTTQRC